MKKNKLTFLIVASFLALSSVVGCEANTPVEHSSKNDETSAQTTSDSGQASTSNQQGNSSGDSDSSGGGNQTGKTDWTDAEKNTMRGALHGIVLPFVDMETTVRPNNDGSSVKIESQQNMSANFLASYAEKFTYDDGWEGGDISYEYEVSSGNAYAYQKSVTENGKKYYVSVMFLGIEQTSGSEQINVSKTGHFYLEATDPYEYEYPAQFIGEWLNQTYGTVIVPPAFQAEFYSLEEEGILVGYSETNIETAYKATVEGSSSFTVDANKNADGYYVAHPSDGSYVLLFKYDSDNKVMILKVEENKGWNAALINKFFTKYNQTPLGLPALEIDGASYKFVEYTDNERYAAQQQYYAVGATYTISKTGLTAAPLVEYARKLREAGFAVNGIANDDGTIDDYYAMKALKDGDLYTLSISFVKTPIGGGKPQIIIRFTADGQEVPNLLAEWPTTQLAAFFGNDIKDALPAFSGVNCGFTFGVNGDVASIAINVDAQVSATIKADYIALLTANNAFTEDNGKYISKNNQYSVRVGDPAGNGLCDIFTIRIEKIHAPVATPWPAENIATAIGDITTYNPTTETLPELDVSSATSCYVGYKDSTHFELIIAGLASSNKDFETVFKNNSWVYDQYFDFINTGSASTSMVGGFVSPGKKLVVHFLVDGNDLVIYVKSYFEPWFTVAGLGGDWNYNHSLVFFEDATVASEVADHWYASQEKAEFTVNANDEFKVTNGVDWYGYEILESNTHFAEGNDHNIKALEKGSVVLYLKTFENGTKGIAINFTPDSSGQQTSADWPSEEISAVLQYWNVNDNIPQLTDSSISDVQFDLADSGKQFTLTIVGGASLIDGYNAQLGEYNPDKEGYVSSSGKLLIKTHASQDDLIVVVKLIEEIKPWPEEALATFFGDVFTSIPEIKIDGASFEIYGEPYDENGVKGIAILVTVDDAANKMASAIQALEQEFNYDYDDTLEMYISSNEGLPYYTFSAPEGVDGMFLVYVAYIPLPVQLTVYKVVGLGDDWNYENGSELEPAENLGEGYSAQYTVTFDVQIGDAFKVTDGTDWFGFEKLVSNDAFGRDGSGNIVAKQQGAVTLQFNILENGNKEIVISFTPDEDQPTELAYKLISEDNWDSLVANDARFYAWVWGGNHGSGEWIELSIDETNHCFYLDGVDINATGFKIVRMSPDAEPDFDTAWNKSASDIAFPEVGLTIRFSIL